MILEREFAEVESHQVSLRVSRQQPCVMHTWKGIDGGDGGHSSVSGGRRRRGQRCAGARGKSGRRRRGWSRSGGGGTTMTARCRRARSGRGRGQRCLLVAHRWLHAAASTTVRSSPFGRIHVSLHFHARLPIRRDSFDNLECQQVLAARRSLSRRSVAHHPSRFDVPESEYSIRSRADEHFQSIHPYQGFHGTLGQGRQGLPAV